ncbi:sulfatase family protein [Stakelama saccharophila]|uniref:Arylsulfatase n=1 Tax=Stakelama saccharophila TaxID=3075605 RepID=A0ABZ0B806_9SPHN|nr:arylsulfatase [Stakelama sp. W311]WNO53556.1 arylsulfatase [Stakelama sp. W311]
MNGNISRRRLLTGSAVALVTAAAANASAFARHGAAARKPNILIIYTDDLGYRDLSCYGATAVSTPNIDRLAKNGVRFTRGHAPSATCTPSRYALLTGDYAWRKEGAHILPGNAPALIPPGKPTIASMLKGAGYTTSVVGKWHLGLGSGDLDWNGRIARGPLEIGFDYAFYFPGTLDRVPTVFIEDHKVVGLDPDDPIRVSYTDNISSDPTGREHPELLRMTSNDGHDGTIVNGVGRIGYMSGGHAARWKDEDMADTLVEKAGAWFEQTGSDPFFMYFSASEIHVPRVPAKRFQGVTGMGPRGDSIAELDWVVGALVQKLEELGKLDDTLIIFSSDNGPVLNDGYNDDAVQKIGEHRPSGPFRSGKYAIFDGGLMVPMIAHWPDAMPAGVVSPARIDHVDLFASLAGLVGQSLGRDAAVDSFDLLPALTGHALDGREYLIEDTSTNIAEESNLTRHSDSIFAFVQGDWKVIKPHGQPTSFHGNEIGNAPAPQLYNITNDPGETVNLAARYPDRTDKMLNRLEAILAGSRTRPQ